MLPAGEFLNYFTEIILNMLLENVIYQCSLSLFVERFPLLNAYLLNYNNINETLVLCPEGRLIQGARTGKFYFYVQKALATGCPKGMI